MTLARLRTWLSTLDVVRVGIWAPAVIGLAAAVYLANRDSISAAAVALGFSAVAVSLSLDTRWATTRVSVGASVRLSMDQENLEVRLVNKGAAPAVIEHVYLYGERFEKMDITNHLVTAMTDTQPVPPLAVRLEKKSDTQTLSLPLLEWARSEGRRAIFPPVRIDVIDSLSGRHRTLVDSEMTHAMYELREYPQFWVATSDNPHPMVADRPRLPKLVPRKRD